MAEDKNKADDGFLGLAFKAGISAAEEIHKTAFQIPINILEGMGAPKDKIDMLRDKSQSMIGELYSAIHTVAAQVGPVSQPDAGQGDSAAGKDQDPPV